MTQLLFAADSGLPSRQNSWKTNAAGFNSGGGSRNYLSQPNRSGGGGQRCSTPKPPGTDPTAGTALTDWREQRHLGARKSLENSINDSFVNLMFARTGDTPRNPPQQQSSNKNSTSTNPVSRLRSGSAVSINRSSMMFQQYHDAMLGSMGLYNQMIPAKQASAGGYTMSPSSGK
ncbi:hypothetical protein Ciccas_004672 [Cichlidogyrus casuarinus]|uniref:Uncharacterized protein n=1 Tax=Cichlidogyrus casuarinus TaxID=1844966 RepID=A0ABD2QAW3_9PLAT